MDAAHFDRLVIKLTRKRFCRAAPGQCICTILADSCTGGGARCDIGFGFNCFRYVTSRGFSFCSNDLDCYPCETDAGGEQRPGGQAGDRCLECHSECDFTTNNIACARSCPNPATG